MVDLVKFALEHKLLSGVGSIALALLGWKIVDIMIFKLMSRAYPEKIILKYIQRLDDEVIDKIKIKTPKVADELENRLVNTLEKAIQIIRDQK